MLLFGVNLENYKIEVFDSKIQNILEKMIQKRGEERLSMSSAYIKMYQLISEIL
jgi:hypothetical protein